MMEGCCAAMALWNGNVYVARGVTLEKLDGHLQVQRSVALPALEARPAAGHEHASQEGTPRQRSHGMMAGKHQMMQMHQGAMSHSRLEVDNTGVYLLRAGRLTVYDHDLNERASRELRLHPSPAGSP